MNKNQVLPYRESQIENAKIIRFRYDIYKYLGDGPINFLEIGTGSGDFADHICSNIQVANLTILDTFEGYNDNLNRHGSSSQEQLAFIQDRFSKKTNLKTVCGDSVTELPKLCKEEPDVRYNFIYIDADHAFDNVSSDISWATKILADGGMIGLDDYCFKPEGSPERDSYEVQEALSSFLDKNPNWEIKFFSFNNKGFQNVFIGKI